MIKKIIIICFLAAFGGILAGCATENIATKDELYRINTNTSEEIISIQDNIAHLRDESGTIKHEMLKHQETLSGVEQRLDNQGSDLGRRVSSLERQSKENQESIDEKLDIILEEINKENKILRDRIYSLEKSLGKNEEYETGYYHMVKKGETLSKIASKYNISLQNIMKSNEISDSNKIKVGQKLFIPEEKN